MKENYRKSLIEGEKAGLRYRLIVPREASAGFTGTELGHQTGSSIDFKDYREYQPGDDLRHIDWHLYARTDKLSIKLYREEVYPHLDIILDGSRSMALEGTEKARGALGLSAIIVTASVNSRCTHRTWVAADTIQEVSNGTQSPSLWEGISFDYGGNPAQGFSHPPAWRKHGIRVFISDLLWLGEPLSILRTLSHGASKVIIIQLLAKADANTPTSGNVRLLDIETGEILELFMDTVACSQYMNALSLHQQNWHHSSRQIAAMFLTVLAEDVVKDWQLDALQEGQILEAV